MSAWCLNRRNFRLLAALLVVFGAALRISGIGGALVYDEVWTLERYVASPVSAIFTDLAIPNNHPLHSLLAKGSMEWLGAGVIQLRLPVLFAGIAALLLAIPLTLRLSRSRGVTLLVLALLALNYPLVGYSHLARGYEIQFALLLAFAWGVSVLAERPRFSVATGTAAAAVAAILTLPTSVLYLIPPLLFLAWKQRRSPAAWTAAVIPGLFSLVWYPLHFQAFRSGQQAFGAVLATPEMFLAFLAEVLVALSGWLLVFVPFGCLDRKRRRLAGLLAVVILFPLAAALLTRAGGARVYLPLVYPLALLAAFGVGFLCRKLRSRPARVAVVAAALLLAVWGCRAGYAGREADLAEVFAEARKLPVNVLPVYRGNEAFAAEWNNRPDITFDLLARIGYRGKEKLWLLQMEADGINGLTEDGGEITLPLGPAPMRIALERNTGRLYELHPLEAAPEPGSVVVAILPLQPEDRLLENGTKLRGLWPGRIALNRPILAPVADKEGRKLVARMFAVAVGEGNMIDWNAVLALCGPEVRLYFCK